MKKYLITIFIISALTGAGGYKGFGLQVGEQGTGIFFHRVWDSNNAIQWLFQGRFFDVKGKDYMMVYDPYTNQYRSVGDKYILIMPMFSGVKYFPFADQIANNFAPYATAQLGPVLTLDGADSDKFMERWKKSRGLWTVGAFIGIGAEFLMYNNMIVSAGAGIDILPMNGKVDGEKHYSGAILHVAFNWRR